MRYLSLLLLFACEPSVELPAQPPVAADVLQRSIDYHDPGGNWATFDAAFIFGQGDNRDTIAIDLADQYFSISGAFGYYVADDGTCRYDIPDGNTGNRSSARDLPLASDSCSTVRRRRDYHTYLNGLPMKLQDPGTPLEETVATANFHGTDYLRLKVNYPKENNTFETWEYFFDPETYALSGYQFYRSDKPDGGEYLLLSGITEVGGVKMIREKQWYLRENDRLLGTDVVIAETTAIRN